MNTTAQSSPGAAKFAERQKRIDDAIALRQPDRVPIVLNSLFWPTRRAGISCRDAMYDYQALSGAVRQALLDLEPDAYVLPHPQMSLGPTMDMIGYRQLKWPGQEGVSHDVPFQYLDAEYMKAEEYDDYIFDPTGFILRKYLPRIARVFEPFARLPNYAGLYYTRILHYTRPYALPQLVESFQELAKAGAEMGRMLTQAKAFSDDMANLGFPLIESATALAPFDYFGDYLRGSKGIMTDMYRHKDKLLEALEKAARLLPEAAVATGKRSSCRIVFIPMHWPGGNMMSPKLFRTFYWPTMRKVAMTLIENDLVPCMFWEGDCTARLEDIGDIPPGKAIYFFEQADIFKAKEVLGDVVCLRGNVPASLLTSGRPEEVRAYVRKLIEVAGKDGGLIVDGSGGVPDEAREENVIEMFKATREYGQY